MQRLLEKALAVQTKIVESAGSTTSLAVARAHFLAGKSNRELGDTNRAQEHLLKAIELLEVMAAHHPGAGERELKQRCLELMATLRSGA